MGKGLDHASGLYLGAIRDGNIDEALNAHLGDRYVQHSTGVGDGKEGFKAFFREFIVRNPERNIQFMRTVEDGRYVFVHAYQELPPSSKWVTMDMFDTDNDGRIIEHWDVIQAYVEKADMKNGNDMVQGDDMEIRDLDKTQVNKTLVKNFVKLILTLHHVHRIEEFVDPDLIQHAPGVKNGRDAFVEELAKGESGSIGKTEMLFQLLGQGDRVVTLSKVRKNDEEHCVFDVYRVADDRIVEHWVTTEAIGPRDQWGNSGKF